MKTLSVTISDLEYSMFGIENENLSFTDFIEIISKELTHRNLNKCIVLAEKYGLSAMTMEEIDNEVKAVRKNAQTCG
jgi:hypothetical protein